MSFISDERHNHRPHFKKRLALAKLQERHGGGSLPRLPRLSTRAQLTKQAPVLQCLCGAWAI